MFTVRMCGIHLGLCLLGAVPLARAQETPYVFAIHGGSGTLSRAALTPETEAAYRGALVRALGIGDSILAAGGSALDAVVAAIVTMEDSPLFNAGKGSVFNSEGKHELDASIMDGKSLNAGAVAALRRVKNPIRLAREVMEHSPHVFLIGSGAEQFAAERGIELVDSSYFFTERRFEEWRRKRTGPTPAEKEGGTVGAVALDRHGHLAAGTSTGGLTNKRWGRVGDSPVIGAGTWADDRTCAVSATGDGEYFIRAAVAHEISALVEYRHLPLQEAAERAIRKMTALGGQGGVVALDCDGNVAFSFTTTGMYRGFVKQGAAPVTAIFGD